MRPRPRLRLWQRPWQLFRVTVAQVVKNKDLGQALMLPGPGVVPEQKRHDGGFVPHSGPVRGNFSETILAETFLGACARTTTLALSEYNLDENYDRTSRILDPVTQVVDVHFWCPCTVAAYGESSWRVVGGATGPTYHILLRARSGQARS